MKTRKRSEDADFIKIKMDTHLEPGRFAKDASGTN
jgi:hypothetical protein